MIAFRPLLQADFPLLRCWLSQPAVNRWYGFDDFGAHPSAAQIHAKFGPKLTNPSMHACIIMLDGRSIGYVQTYPQGAGMGLDLFIGEVALHNQGLGTQILRQLTDQIFARTSTLSISVDPAPDNHRAIRAYQKAGFIEVSRTKVACLMVLSRP